MTYIYQYDTDFTILPESIEDAYEALLAITDDSDDDEQLEGLRVLLREWDFDIGNYDLQGELGVTELEYRGEKQQDEKMDKLFRVLAPFIEPGSYICFYDDQGEHFRYYFAHGMVFHQYGEVVFPEIPKIPDFWSMAPAMQKIILEQIERGVSDAQ